MQTGKHSSAGVYVSEIDLSQRVANVTKTICALVGASARGTVGERVLVTSLKEFGQKFGAANPAISLLHYAAKELAGKTRLYVTRVVNDNPERGELPLTGGCFLTVDDPTSQTPISRLSNFDSSGDPTQQSNTPKGLYDPFKSFQWNPNQAGISSILFMLCFENPGEWNNKMSVRVRSSRRRGSDIQNDVYENPYHFYVEVFEDYQSPRSVPLESWFVSMEHETDGQGNQLHIEEVINNMSSLIRVRLNPYAQSKVKVIGETLVFIAGATNGAKVSKGQIQRGWELYRDQEVVDINVLVQAGAPIGVSDVLDIADIQNTMLSIAEQRMDSIAVLDIPSAHQRYDRAVTYRRQTLNADSSYGAIYTPDVKIYDAENDIDLFVPPSGHVAAAYARTDSEFALWFAPAGMIRGSLNIKGSRQTYGQQERDYLTENQVNAIRYFPDGSGYKIWGADTLQTMASALTNVNVRRLLCFIEKSLSIAMMYSVFNPNDPQLWLQLEDLTDKFLKPIKTAEGLYWYAVKCDGENNTNESVANGDVNVAVYLDPVLPAKRIMLNAILNKTGSRFIASVGERPGA